VRSCRPSLGAGFAGRAPRRARLAAFPFFLITLRRFIGIYLRPVRVLRA
jgi:hypothetical protein